ncbi:hypothetical protein BH09ACT10_BH09ACT10_19820 [soil metagenome]
MQNSREVIGNAGGDDITEFTDGSLIELVRSGSAEAFAILFARHRFAADRLARHLAPRSDADDIVAESFAQVFNQLAQGRGPDSAFRAYLLTSIRHEAGRRGKARQRVRSTDDMYQIDSIDEFVDRPSVDFENTTVRQAFNSLPERWQLVLWHIDIQGKKPHEIADLLEMSPNSVSALAYRARAGLSDAYVQAHVNQAIPTVTDDCVGTRDKLATFASQSLSRRDTRRVAEHLETCSSCMSVLMDIKDVSSRVHRGVSASAVAFASSAGETGSSKYSVTGVSRSVEAS